MQKRLTLVTAAIVALFAALVFVAPALASSTDSRWVGMYVPGAPGDMSVFSSVESRLGSKAAVVSFFVDDTDAFPTKLCNNTVAAGDTPMITWEFLSTQNGGLATINNGSKDAYIKAFADNAKAFGKPLMLRPFHEMNGNWYPWGTGKNTPAQSIAAWRHVHNIFAAEGATNVQFVWCPNVDFNVTNFYPGDAYVDYAAIDGYNNGAPWRSFSSIFAATYTAVANVTSKPIIIAETSCVEGGSGKAAWITDMFNQISTRYTRIVGVVWFEAKLAYDWRVETSNSSVAALKAGMVAHTFLNVVQAPRVQTAVSIRSNVKSVKRKHAVRLSGVLAPGYSGNAVRVVLTVPKHRGSSKVVRTNSAGGWSLRYAPTVRGTYCVRVTYAGDATRLPGVSKTIRIRVK